MSDYGTYSLCDECGDLLERGRCGSCAAEKKRAKLQGMKFFKNEDFDQEDAP